jgi:hypothetical protein
LPGIYWNFNSITTVGFHGRVDLRNSSLDRLIDFRSTLRTLRSSSCGSVRQFDSVGMFLVALVLFRKDLFEPMCLFVSEPLIHKCGIVTYDEFFAASFTPERSHFLETHCFFSVHRLLYCHSLHLLSFSDSFAAAGNESIHDLLFHLDDCTVRTHQHIFAVAVD